MSINEMIAEWRKGCSCAPADAPENCPTCTKALIVAIERRAANMFPPCVSYHVEADPHRAVYQTVEEYLKPTSYGMQIEADDFASQEDFLKAIATNRLFTLQLYPDTPVGFWTCAAPTFEKLVALAWKLHNNRDQQTS